MRSEAIGIEEWVWIRCVLPQISARVWRDLDENAGQGWPEHFTPDGVFDFSGRLTAGRDALRKHFAARLNADPRVTAHLLTNISCDVIDDGEALVAASICVYGGDGTAPLPVSPPTLIGLADDLFRRQPGGAWLIARRRFTPRFYNPDDRVGRRVAHA